MNKKENLQDGSLQEMPLQNQPTQKNGGNLVENVYYLYPGCIEDPYRAHYIYSLIKREEINERLQQLHDRLFKENIEQ